MNMKAGAGRATNQHNEATYEFLDCLELLCSIL